MRYLDFYEPADAVTEFFNMVPKHYIHIDQPDRGNKVLLKTYLAYQHNKPARGSLPGKLQPVPTLEVPWEAVDIPFYGAYTMANCVSGYCISDIDLYSRMLGLIPCQSPITGEETARLFVDNIFKLHGMPPLIVSDRDLNFTSALWSQFTKLLGANLAVSSTMYPQTDGLAESNHRTTHAMVRPFVDENQSTRDALLPVLEFIYNKS